MIFHYGTDRIRAKTDFFLATFFNVCWIQLLYTVLTKLNSTKRNLSKKNLDAKTWRFFFFFSWNLNQPYILILLLFSVLFSFFGSNRFHKSPSIFGASCQKKTKLTNSTYSRQIFLLLLMINNNFGYFFVFFVWLGNWKIFCYFFRSLSLSAYFGIPWIAIWRIIND